jgi:hypothetical protein
MSDGHYVWSFFDGHSLLSIVINKIEAKGCGSVNKELC